MEKNWIKYDLRNPKFRKTLERLGLLEDMKEHDLCAKNIQELKLIISSMKEVLLTLNQKENLTLQDKLFLQKEYDNLKNRYQTLLSSTNFSILKKVQTKLETIADNKIRIIN